MIGIHFKKSAEKLEHKGSYVQKGETHCRAAALPQKCAEALT